MQPTESVGEIFILVVDETYDSGEETSIEDSDKYRKELEDEYGVRFSEADIGPGADIPAFLTVLSTTTIPLWTVILGIFFLGKPINENLDGWTEIGRKIRSFFGKPVVLARHGAAVIAVEAVLDEIGGVPKTIRLLSYRPGHIADPEDLARIQRSNEIHDNVPTITLGYVRHIFEIEADGQFYRVGVDGKVVNILRL
jgi:hypothetical protein